MPATPTKRPPSRPSVKKTGIPESASSSTAKTALPSHFPDTHIHVGSGTAGVFHRGHGDIEAGVLDTASLLWCASISTKCREFCSHYVNPRFLRTGFDDVYVQERTNFCLSEAESQR
jgi:hypothetical protein